MNFCFIDLLQSDWLLLQAYVFELDDEYAESDIPTTLIRSKTDCPNLEVCVCVHVRICVVLGTWTISGN